MTGFPNYPGGKIYEGYRIRPVLREQLDGVLVTRLAIYPYHGTNAIRRALAYLSFMASAFIYLVVKARRQDTAYVFYPALTAGYAALVARMFRRNRVILDIQDMWPDSLEATGMVRGRLINRILSWVCRVQYRWVDEIIVLSKGFRDLIVSRGAKASKISVIFNWADETPARENGGLPTGFDPADTFRVLFAGNMGAAQGLASVLNAAAIVLEARPRARFYFLGSGIEKAELEQRAAMISDRIVFLPRVSLAEVQNYLVNSDCLIVHLRPDPLFAITIPSKTQAYLYAGRPILMAVEGEAAELIVTAGAGEAATPGDAIDIAGKIIKLHDMSPAERSQMGRRGREFYNGNLSFSQGVEAFARLLSRG